MCFFHFAIQKWYKHVRLWHSAIQNWNKHMRFFHFAIQKWHKHVRLWHSAIQNLNKHMRFLHFVINLEPSKSLQMTSWAHLAPKVHLQVKVKYWKCHFLSALHFPEIEGSRCRTSRLQRLSLKSVIFLEGKGWEEKAWRWRRSQRLTSLILKTLHLP